MLNSILVGSDEEGNPKVPLHYASTFPKVAEFMAKMSDDERFIVAKLGNYLHDLKNECKRLTDLVTTLDKGALSEGASKILAQNGIFESPLKMNGILSVGIILLFLISQILKLDHQMFNHNYRVPQHRICPMKSSIRLYFV